MFVRTKGINMKTRLLFSIIIISFLGVNTSKAQEIQNKIAPTQIENGISRKASFNLEEIKVRWKKSALENCTGTPCVSGNTCSAGTAIPQNVFRGTSMTSMTHVTVGATGIGTVTGLPLGVTATWSNNTITISGTPAVTVAGGVYNYSILLTGCTNSITATGNINVMVPN
jgi:hypothetical protein